MFVAALLLGSILQPISPIVSVDAATPTAAKCQEGLFQKAKPNQDALCPAASGDEVSSEALPSGFQESVVWSGLSNPVAVRFAADGRVVVAEKSGVIKIFESLTDATPTTYAGLTTEVQNHWDRGLLGLALDPTLTGDPGGTGSFVYVLYAYDHILGTGGSAPKWGDQCLAPPNGPGATTDGCVISGRLSRFPISGTSILDEEEVLIEDWCQQYPSHSVGGLAFGPDGALYLSGGDGASFNVVDYGQLGGTTTPIFTAKNPCGDPPNNGMVPPTAEGGALRSQDIRVIPAPSPYRATVLADTPIAYWRLGDTSGVIAVDEVGGNNGTYLNAPALGVPGAVGDGNTAVTFNGTDEAIAAFGNSAPFRFAATAPFSVEAWVKHTPDGNYRRILSAENGNGAGWQLYSQNGDYGLWRYDGTSGGGAAVFAPIGTGWHHLVATYDGSSARIYKDGILVAGPTPDSRSLPSDASLAIAKYAGGTSTAFHFNGSIDEVAVYGYSLSAAQVAGHFTAAASTSSADPIGLDGSILRVDPASGAGMPGNPFASSPDANAKRIIAYGLRNPFRIAFRPGTNELWFGDVGWNTWEELNRIPNATDAIAENFGWPCYEGNARQGGYDGTNLNLCETLYAQGAGAVAAPYYTYNHNAKVASETCPVGGSSITGVAFYPAAGGSYPASYGGGVFFADHTRNCIWFMPKGTNGQPDAAQVVAFIDPAAHPVDLVIGPGGDLFYVDFEGGTIRRVTFAGGNQQPSAVIAANPTSGPAPLTVQFNGGGSSDPEGGLLTYAWDLDGDGQYNDGTAVTASRTYSAPGNVTVGLRVTDDGTATGFDTQVIQVGNSPPIPVIGDPTAETTWRVGDTISFNGTATDPQDGTVPATGLSWSAAIVHCPSNCHTHPPFFTLAGEASGTFGAPDHDYPASIEITLTATDSNGTTASVKRTISAQGVALTFQTSPPGLSLTLNGAAGVGPFTRTAIIGSANSVTATSPQTLNGVSYVFTGWSDGGAQSHAITAPASPTTYTATFQATGFSVAPSADAQIRSNQAGKNFGTATILRVKLNASRAYLKFTVSGLSGPAANAKLRLWVTEGGTNGGSVYRVTNTSWTETGITWNNAPAITGAALATVGTVTTGTWVEFNLGTAITGNGTYTFAISNGNSNQVDYASRETTNDALLVITP